MKENDVVVNAVESEIMEYQCWTDEKILELEAALRLSMSEDKKKNVGMVR